VRHIKRVFESPGFDNECNHKIRLGSEKALHWAAVMVEQVENRKGNLDNEEYVGFGMRLKLHC
jgi:hypothetical protein